MEDSFNVEETLDQYGYSKSTSTGVKVGYILLALALLVATAAAALLGKLWSDEKYKVLEAENSFKTMSRRVSEMETRNSELSSLLTDKQSELERLRVEWSNQVTELEASHKEQIQRTFAQMNEIVYDSKKTLTYIHDIETRLRSGQKMDRDEAKKLESVVNGLAFLHEQYKKPMAEFKELDRYFQQQLDSIPSSKPTSSSVRAAPVARVTRPDPVQNAGLLKRIFNGKKLKEERDKYLQEQGRAQGIVEGRVTGQKEGRRQALVEAQRKVRTAYAKAQAQMNALALDKNKYLAQLNQMVESNQKSANDVEDFFTKSKEILKIHDEIMNFEPSKVPSIRP